MAVPATVIYFTTYDQLRDYLHARMGSWNHYIPLLAGALARREYPSSLGSPHAHPVSWQVSVPTLSAWLSWRGAGGSGTAAGADRAHRLCPFCCSGCCDGHQPPGADPHQDAVAAAQLPRAARLHPVGGGPGRLAVPLERLGTHRAAGRPLLGYAWGHGETGAALRWGVPRGSTGVSSPPALYWFNYELVRTWLCRQPWLDGATFTVSFASGAISGTVSLGRWGCGREERGWDGAGR